MLRANKTFLTVLIPAKNCADELADTVPQLYEMLKTKLLDQTFQIILIPNGAESNRKDETAQAAEMLAEKYAEVSVCHHCDPKGKGAALRSGFAVAEGEWILLCDSDLPFTIGSIENAIDHLGPEVDFLTANRRIPGSEFHVPVRLLNLVYRRHVMGLLFNKFSSLLLPIDSSDSQAGLKVLRRKLAEKVFSLQMSEGFLFDLEMFIVCRTHGFKHREFPVRFRLRNEVSTVRLMRELVRSLKGLSELTFRFRSGHYSPKKLSLVPGREFSNYASVTADDWGLTPGVNDGILSLAQAGVVKRVSVLANGAYVNHRIHELLAVPGVEIGLHFNLTLGEPTNEELIGGPLDLVVCPKTNRYHSLKRQFLNSWLAGVSPLARHRRYRAQVASAFDGQMRRLQSFGITPVYFDGHHHVHLAPCMLGFLADSLKAWQMKHTRLVLDGSIAFSSKFPILILSLLAKRNFKRLNLVYHRCLYPSMRDLRYPDRIFNRMTDKRTVEIITHPAMMGDLHNYQVADGYNGARVMEYIALAAFTVATNA